MKLYNANELMDAAMRGGYALPALNANGATYDIARAILEAADELRSPVIIQAYEPNLEYRGYDYFTMLVKHLAADLDVPIAISLDHGKSVESVMRAVRAGFTHVMFDFASHPIEENIAATNLVASLVHPLGVSLEAEIGHMAVRATGEQVQGFVTPLDEAVRFAEAADIDFLALGVGTNHGIFDRQDQIDFAHIRAAKQHIDLPIVLHGTCGVSMADVARCVAAGMNKINFGEGLRAKYIRDWQELAADFPHEQHAWRIMREAKDRMKAYVKTIIRAVGSDGRIQ